MYLYKFEIHIKTYVNTNYCCTEYGIHLTQCSLDQDGAQAVRQLCSVLLKQYVESHWTQYSPKFCPPETPQKVLCAIYPRVLYIYYI